MKTTTTSNLVAVLFCALAPMGSVNAQNKPNVVIMLGDNVGYGEIGAYGVGEVRGMPTPRIDSIASRGSVITRRRWRSFPIRSPKS
jgi:arylsulfatase